MFDAETQRALLAEFISENREALGLIETQLMQLESDPGNRELLNAVFRHMHTVKGNCRMLGFGRLEELTHTAENLLDQVREGKLRITQRMGTVLLGVVDSVRRTLALIEESGAEGDPDFSRQIAGLSELQHEGDSVGEATEGDDSLESPKEEIPDLDLSSPQGGASVDLKTVRLPIGRLDALMDLVGELGASFNQLRYAATRNKEVLNQALESLDRQIQELQGEVLKYRLQPVGPVWDSYHRLVRDLALETGKKVVLEMSGGETEVDRNVLLSIKDLLGHLIRNAVDHGLEPPDDRVAKGKPPLGRIELTATQRHGRIIMEIADDGGGIHVDLVRGRAADLGLASAQELAEMSDQEVLKFIMEPGFSTARQVSRISGRGAGMDVVRSAVEKVGGTIAIFSEPDQGTRFQLRIPQTTAIVPALLVGSGREQYAIPQVNILELVSYFGDEARSHIEGKLGSLMVRVRGRLHPLVRLDESLIEPPTGSRRPVLPDVRQMAACHVVMLRSEDGDFGLLVERIEEPVNLVIKPMLRLFAHIAILAGAAIMPDGSVSFLLNITELGRLSRR